jgi:hypothetical protein
VSYNARTVLRKLLIPITFWLSLGFLVSGCGNGGKELNLHDRIIAADTTKYCGADGRCFDPQVIADESGFDVTTFIGSKLQSTHVPAKDLASYLRALPMEAWPGGPSVIVSLTDVATDPHAVEQNYKVAQQVCHSLGLEVHLHAGG